MLPWAAVVSARTAEAMQSQKESSELIFGRF